MLGQIHLFDLIKAESKEFKPVEALALRGSPFSGGYKRIVEYFSQNSSIKDKARFLQREYGIGGFGSPIREPYYIHEVNHSGGTNISFKYYDQNVVSHEVSITFEELAKTITEMLARGVYKEG